MKENKCKFKMRWLWLFARCTLWLLLGSAAVSWLAYTRWLAPQPGEMDHVLNIGWVQLPVSVPRAIAVAASPQVAPWLRGYKRFTRVGWVQLDWDIEQQALVMHCAPCTINMPALGSQPIVLKQATLTLHSDSLQAMHGQIHVGQTPQQIQLNWHGQWQAEALTISADLAQTPISDVYNSIFPDLPALKYARIGGTVAMQAQLSWPQEHLAFVPQVHGFTVSGLGTQGLIGAQSGCGRPSRLAANSWLTRAVIAAEDQRFESHTGYDLEELLEAHDRNQLQAIVVRGGSTINQQLAKLLITGDERSIQRKMSELLYAVEMESSLGKARILQLYLDNVPWGRDDQGELLCGAQSAAQHYFKRNAASLTPAQAVWLAAMIHNPQMEVTHWQDNGMINLPRALWVASQVRNAQGGSGPRRRQRVMQTLIDDPAMGMKKPEQIQP